MSQTPTPAAPKKPNAFFWWIRRHPKWSAVIGIVVVVVIIGSVTGGNGGDDKNTSNSSSSSTSSKTHSTASKSAAATSKSNKPEDLIQAALGDDADGVKTTKIGANAYAVKFKIKDNFTNGMIRDGIALDVFHMLKAVSTQGAPKGTYKLQFQGTFAMQDKYGKAITPDPVVFNATFNRATADKIQYDNINAASWDTLKELADGDVWLHPAFN